jgi:hypothetical protein
VLADRSLVINRAVGKDVVTVVRPVPPYGTVANLTYEPGAWVDVTHLPGLSDYLPAPTKSRQLDVEGMHAVAAMSPDAIATVVKQQWPRSFVGKAGRLPADALSDLILSGCRWIDSIRWFGDDTAPPAAAERLTVHEVLVCIARRYPLGGWVGLLRDEGVLAPRDLPNDPVGRAHHAEWDKRGKNPRTGELL